MEKGALKGLCNRSACLKPGAIWYNHSTRKHYCTDCAYLINDANRNEEFVRELGHDLCTLVEDDFYLPTEYVNPFHLVPSYPEPIYLTPQYSRVLGNTSSKLNCKKGHTYIGGKCGCGKEMPN